MGRPDAAPECLFRNQIGGTNPGLDHYRAGSSQREVLAGPSPQEYGVLEHTAIGQEVKRLDDKLDPPTTTLPVPVTASPTVA